MLWENRHDVILCADRTAFESFRLCQSSKISTGMAIESGLVSSGGARAPPGQLLGYQWFCGSTIQVVLFLHFAVEKTF